MLENKREIEDRKRIFVSALYYKQKTETLDGIGYKMIVDVDVPKGYKYKYMYMCVCIQG